MHQNDLTIVTLVNGVRIVAMPMPHVLSASVGVFVHTGSRNETGRTNGISHFLEHMAFKGTATRNAQEINLDAERLGISMNAFTGTDMTAYYMNGLGKHAEPMLRMLADIVVHPTFPEDEIERERDVILQEATEYEEDPSDLSNVLLDGAIYGKQAMGMPVIGTRKNIARFNRQDLLDCVARQYTGPNVIVAFAGCIDPSELTRWASELFKSLPCGTVNRIEEPHHLGGVRTKSLRGVSQVFANIAFPVNSITAGHHAAQLAATLFGGGMSSPLSNEIRERMGLAYHVGSNPEIGDVFGHFVIDAVTTPEKLPAFYSATAALLKQHAEGVDPIQLERAKNQISVGCVMGAERPFSVLQSAIEDLFCHGRVIGVAETLAAIDAVNGEDVRAVFDRMLRARPAMSLVGKGASANACEAFESALIA